MRRPVRLATWLLIGLMTAACATSPAPGSRVEADGNPGAGPAGQSAGADAHGQTPPPASAATATLALLEQSERAARNGSLDEALAYAERAVRIDPRNAMLWTRLAALELDNGNPQAALQYADKALSLAADRPDLQRAAWLVIADAREATGDSEAATAIRARYQTGRG